MAKVSMNATLAELKAAIAPKLTAGGTALKPDELKLKRSDGTAHAGITRVSLKGETPAYGTENVCAAIQAIAARGEPVSALAIQRQVKAQVRGGSHFVPRRVLCPPACPPARRESESQR